VISVHVIIWLILSTKSKREKWGKRETEEQINRETEKQKKQRKRDKEREKES
jgi:hypothetical protein